MSLWEVMTRNVGITVHTCIPSTPQAGGRRIKNLRPGMAMAKKVKVLATKPNDMSSIPMTQI